MPRPRPSFTLKEWGIIIALLCLSLFLLMSVVDVFQKEEAARKQAAFSKKELLVTEERKQTLEKEIALLESERGKEAVIREMFGVARPNEEVIIVVPKEEGETLTPISWWRKVLGWFGL